MCKSGPVCKALAEQQKAAEEAEEAKLKARPTVSRTVGLGEPGVDV